MVKLFLASKSIENQLIKRISEGCDQGILRDICMPCRDNHCHVIIAYCGDFTKRWEGYNDGATLRAHFQTLYNRWIPGKYNVEIVNFSFNDESGRMMELLNAPAPGSATIFYMGGVHARLGSARIGAPPAYVRQLIAMLKSKVQGNEIAYIGICGGGTLAGKSTAYVHIPFDLLSGTNIVYDSSVNAKSNDVKTRHTVSDTMIEDVVHFTTGCAIAVVLTADSCRALSFSTLKNTKQWLTFAAKNTLALQKWLHVKACTSLLLQQPLAHEDIGGRLRNSIELRQPHQHLAHEASIATQLTHQPLAHEDLNQMD